MWLRIFLIVVGCVWFKTPACGQVVLLPSTGTFSVNTSVLIPDQGSVSLGGVNRSASGSNYRSGIPSNRSHGSGVSASGATVHAQIIDLDAIDRAILGTTASAPQSKQTPKKSSSNESDNLDNSKPNPVANLAGYLRGRNLTARTPEYAYMLAMHEATSKTIQKYEPNEEDVKHFLLQAQQAKRDQRWSAAEVYYKQAWLRLTPESQRSILASLQVQEPKQATASVSSSAKRLSK